MQQHNPEPASVAPPEQPEPSPDLHNGLSLLTREKSSFRWYHKLAAVMAAVFCFELGVFLLIYPWVKEWDVNASVIPAWGREFWTSPWFRGAISGLGLLNMYISFTEVFRLRRFSS